MVALRPFPPAKRRAAGSFANPARAVATSGKSFATTGRNHQSMGLLAQPFTAIKLPCPTQASCS